MKITVDSGLLADAAAWAARALPSRPATPVLACMHLQAADGQLIISTYDYDVSTQGVLTAGVTVASEGSALVSGRLFAQIIQTLPGKPVDLTADDGRLIVSCGASRFTLPLVSEDEYPALPALPPLAGTIGSDLLATAVSQAAVAAGTDDTLPILTGIRVEADGDGLTLVATNRYQLAVRIMNWEPAAELAGLAVTVPARTFIEAARAMTSTAQVTVHADPAAAATDGGIIGFQAGGRTLTTRLLGGKFPPYQKLLLTEFAATAQLPAAEFVEAVKRVAVVADRDIPVRLTFRANQVGIAVTGGSPDGAQASDDVDAEFGGPDDFTIDFQAGPLTAGVIATGTETVTLSMVAADKPAIVTGTKPQGEEPAYQYVVVPVRPAS